MSQPLYETNRMGNRNRPSLRAVPMSLFPTLGSLQEVVDLAESKVPITERNELYSLLMAYHNTLIAQINQANVQ